MITDELKRELKFGQPKHKQVAEAIRSRVRMSERQMRGRYAAMAKNEEVFQAYIPETTNDAVRRGLRDSGGLPQYRTIEIPQSYAVLMTAHTYYTTVFLGRAPVFQLKGRHGETEQQVQAHEAILDYQRLVGEMMIPMFIWLLDPGKYGFGVVGHYWDKQMTRVRQIVEEPVTFLGLPIGDKKRKVEKVFDIPSYEGNKLYNVRPQDFFPDPRVALRYFQQGEFCARYVENSWFSIAAGARAGEYFNVDKLKEMRKDKDMDQDHNTIVGRDQGSGRVMQLPKADETGVDSEPIPAGFVKSFEVYIKLVPTEWRLGDGDREEMWVFTISTNGILYGAGPLGEFHGKFPFDVQEHEPEGYSMFSRSMLEVSRPLNDVITWLINSHFYNVRAALNNMWLVDPSMVVMKDLEDPNPGKAIRLKPEAYGRDIKSFLSQLQVSDVTRNNIADIGMVMEFMQRVLGTNDQMMGLAAAKSHTTATAVRTSTTFGVNRMKTNCEYYSAMGWAPLTQKLVQRTQQRMSKEQQYRIVGDIATFGEQFVNVGPDGIAGFYDFVPVDGTMPVDRFAQANLWQQIMGQMMKFPQIAQTYDIAKIFGWVARLGGINNLAQFRVLPDQQVLQQAQAGNVIPMAQAAQPRANLNEPRQLPNLGATG